MWYSPTQPIEVSLRGANAELTLVMVDFIGKPIETDLAVTVKPDQTVDLRSYWPQLKTPGTYLVLAVPKGAGTVDFVGTPLVVQVRSSRRPDAIAGPMVVKVEPLRYGVISTDKGDMTVQFYYDVAPHTVANFAALADQGFYDGLPFYRVKPGFVIQTGDPRGDGTGGPGYNVDAEFNSREHQRGVLSMARQIDPLERQGAMPRAEAANSAGSQFFICLDYERTKQFDGRYTAFAEVTAGLETVGQIEQVATQPDTEKPLNPPMMKSIRVLPVTSSMNPYAERLKLSRVPADTPKAPTSDLPAGVIPQ
jgi:cyclophilin family peptidyl-prolyl cis-trans isomerase